MQVDVTYPGTNAFPYMLNFVSYNDGTLVFQTVARVLMNRLTVAAYKFAFEKVFNCVTNIHPEFENGNHVKAFIVDYSSAQHSGLSSAVGERASEIIRGCSVHYQRMAQKVADKVAPKDRNSRKVFLKIAYKIQFLDDQVEVNLLFDVLCGLVPLDEASDIVGLSDTELNVDTTNWNAATEWVKWWTKPKVLKMFTKSFKDMSEADWDICPRTTNAVESHNKLSNARTTLFLSALSTYYRVDKKSAYDSIAAELGVAVGPTKEQRRRNNKKRKLYRLRAKSTIVEQSQAEDEETAGLEFPGSQIVENDLDGVAQIEQTQETVDSDVVDDYIGKIVWVDTVGVRGKHFGWCECVIVRKEGVNYIGKFVRWPEHFVEIPDLFDESEVMHVSPIPLAAEAEQV